MLIKILGEVFSTSAYRIIKIDSPLPNQKTLTAFLGYLLFDRIGEIVTLDYILFSIFEVLLLTLYFARFNEVLLLSFYFALIWGLMRSYTLDLLSTFDVSLSCSYYSTKKSICQLEIEGFGRHPKKPLFSRVLRHFLQIDRCSLHYRIVSPLSYEFSSRFANRLKRHSRSRAFCGVKTKC